MEFERSLRWCAFASAITVAISALGGRSKRVYGRMGEDGFTIATEAGTRWAVWAVIGAAIAVIALGLVPLALKKHAELVPATCGIAAVALAVVALIAGQHWIRLLEERGRPRDYILDISPGLPIAAVTAAIGSGFALVLGMAYLAALLGGRAPNERAQERSLKGYR